MYRFITYDGHAEDPNREILYKLFPHIEFKTTRTKLPHALGDITMVSCYLNEEEYILLKLCADVSQFKIKKEMWPGSFFYEHV